MTRGAIDLGRLERDLLDTAASLVDAQRRRLTTRSVRNAQSKATEVSMGFNSITLFDMAHKNMRYLNQRQDVLAQNVANADTPDYQARDLVPLDFDKTLAQQFYRLHMKPTAMGVSLPGTLPTDPKFREHDSRMVYEESIDGNDVILEEQLLKVQETQMAYQASTRLIRKYHTMMKMALGRNGV